MDFFEIVFRHQVAKQQAMRNSTSADETSLSYLWTAVDWINAYIGYMYDELAEVRKEIPHKFWKHTPSCQNVDNTQLKAELADVFIHWLNLCDACGYNADEMKDAVQAKQEYNAKRSDQQVKTTVRMSEVTEKVSRYTVTMCLENGYIVKEGGYETLDGENGLFRLADKLQQLNSIAYFSNGYDLATGDIRFDEDLEMHVVDVQITLL